jgi:hypothetical protein
VSSSAEADARRRGGVSLGQRLGDARYCAPCGILFADVCDAQRHRREDHPEQARFERPLAPEKAPPPKYTIEPSAAAMVGDYGDLEWHGEFLSPTREG